MLTHQLMTKWRETSPDFVLLFLLRSESHVVLEPVLVVVIRPRGHTPWTPSLFQHSSSEMSRLNLCVESCLGLNRKVSQRQLRKRNAFTYERVILDTSALRYRLLFCTYSCVCATMHLESILWFYIIVYLCFSFYHMHAHLRQNSQVCGIYLDLLSENTEKIKAWNDTRNPPPLWKCNNCRKTVHWY